MSSERVYIVTEVDEEERWRMTKRPKYHFAEFILQDHKKSIRVFYQVYDYKMPTNYVAVAGQNYGNGKCARFHLAKPM